MSAPQILGIDPGAHGAIAVLDQAGELIAVHDMPSTPEANGRTATNAPLLARKCDVDRAEAALIGWAGLQREARL